MTNVSDRCDVLVIGGGAAGLYAALVAAELGAEVTVVSRKPLDQSASYWAQGGIAAALGAEDSPQLHVGDTLAAGRELCRRSAVEALASEAPGAVEDLSRRGVHFDADRHGNLALGLEGGHSRRRVVHAGGSATGRRVTRQLSALVANHDRITALEGYSALALWSDGERCHGAVTDHGTIASGATILATGGMAALWRRTSNPWGAIGAGAVIAHSAGAELADLELCQFHPTALAMPGHRLDGFLVTEAIRGEGATLHGADGERFTDELAPRDAVTEAILDRTATDGSGHVLLDMRSVDPSRFPNIGAALREAGLDPRQDLIPVSPAAHYGMGGIATDLDGHSSLAGLYAVGECACTGLHGANRLASNSLTECFVFSRRAAQSAAGDESPLPARTGREAEDSGGSARGRRRVRRPRNSPAHRLECESSAGNWRFEPPTDATRDAMWEHAGPRRSEESLRALLSDPYPLARLIAASALAREESRGAHIRSDRPQTDPNLDCIHFVVESSGNLRKERWD